MLIFFLPMAFAFLEISEIMSAPNSEWGGSSNEWVELYNPESSEFDLFNCSFQGKQLKGVVSPNSYLVLVRTESSFTASYNPNIIHTQLSFGTGLKNSGDNLNLSCNGSLIDQLEYKGISGNTDRTLEKAETGKWKNSLIAGGTPGQKNSVSDAILENYPENNLENDSEIAENKTAQPQTDDSNEIASSLCDLQIQIETANESIFYKSGQSIKFKPELNSKSSSFEIEYWIEDLFGVIVKKRLNTSNTNQKTWKTDIEEEDRVLLIKAVVHPACNDTNFDNNLAEHLFIVIKDDSGQDNLESDNSEKSSSEKEIEEKKETKGIQSRSSTINITKISPEKASFGDLINAEIEVYKNTTDKYSLSAWVEKNGQAISEKTKFHLKNKNTAYQLTLPLQLEINCDASVKKETVKLIVEGLGLSGEKTFMIEGINKEWCKEFGKEFSEEPEKLDRKKESNTEITKVKDMIKIVNLPTEIEAGEDLNVQLQIEVDQDTEFEAWSYLYRGSKCYSCASGKEERDQHTLSFSVDQGEKKEVEIPIKADQDLADGEYKLMVKYRIDAQKTEKSMSTIITIKALQEETRTANQTVSLLSASEHSVSVLNSEKNPAQELPGYQGIVVYQSTSEKSKSLISWVLLVTFGLLCLVLVWKKK